MRKLESLQRLIPILNMAEVVIRSPLGNCICEKSSTKLGKTQIDTNALCFKAGVLYSFRVPDRRSVNPSHSGEGWG